MIPKQAIEKAIEGGWTECKAVNSAQYILYAIEVREISEADYAAIALDPTFWQALGKALGWDKDAERILYPVWRKYSETDMTLLGDDWENAAHTFLDLILTGCDTEKFWEEILA